MQPLIRICCALLSLGGVWAGHCRTVSGKLALDTGKDWNDIVQEHFATYKRLANFEDLTVLRQSSMTTVLDWPLAQQAKHGDYVAKRMANECEHSFIAFAELAAKELQALIDNEDSFHNNGSVCNVAFLIQTLPEGKLRSELISLRYKLTDLTRQNLGQMKFDL